MEAAVVQVIRIRTTLMRFKYLNQVNGGVGGARHLGGVQGWEIRACAVGSCTSCALRERRVVNYPPSPSLITYYNSIITIRILSALLKGVTVQGLRCAPHFAGLLEGPQNIVLQASISRLI